MVIAKNKARLTKVMKDMYDEVNSRIRNVQRDAGPQIGDQNKVIMGWWRQMADTYGDNMDVSFVNDLPTEIVSSFLVRKGVVMNANEA